MCSSVDNERFVQTSLHPVIDLSLNVLPQRDTLAPQSLKQSCTLLVGKTPAIIAEHFYCDGMTGSIHLFFERFIERDDTHNREGGSRCGVPYLQDERIG